MERLTEDSVTGETYIKQCASSCPYDGDFCGTDECPVLNAVADKLGEYERAEEQGLLVRLPCKVGTEVFCFFPGDSHYTKCQIKKIEICPSIFGKGLGYYSSNIIHAITPYATADAGLISTVLRHLASEIEEKNPGAKEMREWAETHVEKPELKEIKRIKKPNCK